jgi:hypothetical protein
MQQQSNNDVAPGPLVDTGEPLDLGAFQFEHVENWILNDGFLFDP